MTETYAVGEEDELDDGSLPIEDKSIYRYWILIEGVNTYTRWNKNPVKGFKTRNEAESAVIGKGIPNWVIVHTLGRPSRVMNF